LSSGIRGSTIITNLVSIIQFGPARKESNIEQFPGERRVKISQTRTSSEGVGRRFFHEFYGESLNPFIPIFTSLDLRYIPCLFEVLLIDYHLLDFRRSDLRNLCFFDRPVRVLGIRNRYNDRIWTNRRLKAIEFWSGCSPLRSFMIRLSYFE
jgi:hypothetical protein